MVQNITIAIGITHILKIPKRPNINFLWRFWLTVSCLEVIYQSAVFLIIANMEISNHHCQSKHVKCSFLALLLDSWFARRDKVLKYTWKKSYFPLIIHTLDYIWDKIQGMVGGIFHFVKILTLSQQAHDPHPFRPPSPLPPPPLHCMNSALVLSSR